MEQALEELQEKLPSRTVQIGQLYDLFAHEDEPFVESIYVYGGPSSGKSVVVTSVLEKLRLNFVTVNLIECYTAKILFEYVLNKLSGHKMDPRDPAPYARCDNLMDFIDHLHEISRMKENLDKSVLVFDKAEEFRNMDGNLLPALLRLSHLSQIEFTVVLISEIVFEKFYSRTATVQPFKLYFPQYNKDQLLDILALDFPYAQKLIANNSAHAIEFDVEFYKNYLNFFLSVFYRACRDLAELRRMSRDNFLKYCQPIINKQNSVGDQMALWRNIAPILKTSLDVLYLRIDAQSSNPTPSGIRDNSAQSLELPFYAKYLLIAAYLASYNSTKDDKRLFMKNHGKRKKTRADVSAKNKVSERLNTQLGPKPFTFDRLLAIFYSILEEKVGFNNNLLVQVSSLVELRLLSTASDNWSLDGQKYKCNVNYDFIHCIAKMVGFNIRKYLSDFSHV